jgi:hypothetical protein
MREAILQSIRSRRITTFQHLTVDVSGFRGTVGMFTPERDSIIIWHACSPEAITTLGSLMADKSIRMHPAPNISYRATGDLPPVDICRSVDDLASDTPVIRWFPVVFTEPSIVALDLARERA